MHCLKGESEFLRQVKMQNCKGSLELENANSSTGSVSNQVLFTSHIVLKTDVIPIPSTLTCHHLQREIYLFEKNQIQLVDASSEPAVVAEGRKPARNSPQKKYSQDLGKMREEPVNQCHSKRSRRFLFPRRLRLRRFGSSGVGPSGAEPGCRCPPAPARAGSRSGATPGGGGGEAGGKDLPLQQGSVPVLEMLHPRWGGAGRVPVGSEPAAGGTPTGSPAEPVQLRLPAVEVSGRSRAPPASFAPSGGGVGASEGNQNSSSLACRSCPGCLCSGDGPGPGREGICHR